MIDITNIGTVYEFSAVLKSIILSSDYESNTKPHN